MNPENNIFNGMNNTASGNSAAGTPPTPPPTSANIFNGQSPAPQSFPLSNSVPSQPSIPTPTPTQQFQQQPPQQPFFGFSPENENQSSTAAIPQVPQNQNQNQPLPSQPYQTPPQNGILTPTQPLPNNQKQKNRPPVSPQQTIKKFTILTITLGIAAVIFLFLGIWGLIDAVSTRSQLANSNSLLSTYSTIVAEIENQTGASISSLEDLPTYQPASDYVYITDWGIKLKIPDTLTSISYILNQNANYHSYICFAAVQSGVQYFPAFADINQNRDGIGCLYRIPVTDGDKDSNGVSYGQNVLTKNDYNYFYREPSRLYSGSEAEKNLETTARDLVKQMIVDISTY